MTVQLTTVPADSALAGTLATASFFDAHTAPLHDTELSPADIAARLFRATPDWANALMRLRNSIVRQLGLKDVGDLKLSASKPADELQPGDAFGIFSIFAISEREIVLGIDDSHLDVRVSVTKAADATRATYTVSTVVHVHNWLGRLYMLPVARIHPIIVRAGMRRAGM